MSIGDEVINWLHSRPNWQQEAVLRSLENSGLKDSDIDELTALCKKDEGQKITNTHSFPNLADHHQPNQVIQIISLGEIQGIENLNPRKAVHFGEKNLVVVYGNNASGKSSYVRVIKSACGKANSKELRTNVFMNAPEKRSCKFEYKINDRNDTKEWIVGESVLNDLEGIDVFDTDRGRLYLNKEREVSYSPRLLVVFDNLVQACERVKQRLTSETYAIPIKLPVIPTEYANTHAGKLFVSLRATHTEKDIGDIISWTECDQKKLDEINERLKTEDPASLAVIKKNQKSQIENIISKINDVFSAFSPASCTHLVNLKNDAINKRRIAIEGAMHVIKSAHLDGVGSDTWRALWNAARLYSQEQAYPSAVFPHTEGARCVLCQQEILPNAQKRLHEFETYVKGELETAASKAATDYKSVMDSFPLILDENMLKTTCQASGLKEEEWLPQLLLLWEAAKTTKEKLLSSTPEKAEAMTQEKYPWVTVLHEKSVSLGKQASQHDVDAKLFDRAKAILDKTELSAKKWTAQQALSIKEEIKRLKTIAQYNEWIRKTDHTAISRKASEIAEKVITSEYIRRFNDELNKLGAKRIRVELVKTRAERGKVLHSIKLRGVLVSSVTPEDILSDGEKRIVGLAAFLADTMGGENMSPIIFDDPISSLDQDFEEKTIDRIIELSCNRQAIIFTHRLSFLGILCEKSEPNVICVRSEQWGVGEPGDVPLIGQKNPDRAMKKLRDERLAQAEKVLKENGSEFYYPLAKSICSDFRILVERIVEFVLLADVIQRHRRDVQTKGKIHNLVKIGKEDCDIIDYYMTKYSCYEHSQPLESPVDVPMPHEIKEDINSLLKWHDDFKKRAVEAQS